MANFSPTPAAILAPAIALPALKILNPTPAHLLNYDYGYTKKRPVTHLNSKARAGAPYFREMTDVPHQFLLSWIDRPRSTALALKQMYEQYKGGAFVLVDHEGGGRQYVGRFTTPVEPVATMNATWAIQSVQFDELPGVAMPVYPHDWEHDAIWMEAIDFEGNVQVTTSGVWPILTAPTARFGFEAASANATAGDWAQMQYVGYGFQLWARTGPDMGIAAVFLDGVQLGTIDFYAAAATSAAALISYLPVPYGMHLVKLIATNSKNAASSGNTIVWDSLRVMR